MGKWKEKAVAVALQQPHLDSSLGTWSSCEFVLPSLLKDRAQDEASPLVVLGWGRWIYLGPLAAETVSCCGCYFEDLACNIWAISKAQARGPVASLAATSLVFGVAAHQDWLSLVAPTFLYPADVGFSLPRVQSIQPPSVPVCPLLPKPACSKISLKLCLGSVCRLPAPLQLSPSVPQDWNVRHKTSLRGHEAGTATWWKHLGVSQKTHLTVVLPHC